MTVTILCGGERRELPALSGQTLLDVIRSGEGLPVHAPCGGAGTCKKCRVFLAEDGKEREVLACRTEATDGMTVRLPSGHELAVQLSAEGTACAPDEGLTGYGIACDIGTTTVVCRLVELSTGRVLAARGEGNAQRPYGGDVISRIKAAMEGHRPALTAALTGQLSRMIETLCAEAGIGTEKISAMAAAANTTMCHFLTGLAPDGLGAAPFTPLSRFGESYEASSLGLPFDGPVYVAPAVSSYVGGDITADLLAAGLDETEVPTLLIDVGTNGEMVLGCGERFVCCSTAAGPAFEGAQISCGMTAAPGAVSAVDVRDGKVTCSVIGGGKAAGLCGSGLIDAVAAMLTLGALDETGRLLDPEEDEDEIPGAALPHLFHTEEDEPAFRLTEDVYVTQGDVRRLQLGKGAIAAGVKVLTDAWGGLDRVGALLLAGGFGSYIRPESAARIGLIPRELLPVTRAVGNTAAEGARMALVSRVARERLTALQNHMEYRELSGLAEFNSAYLDAMLFPEED